MSKEFSKVCVIFLQHESKHKVVTLVHLVLLVIMEIISLILDSFVINGFDLEKIKQIARKKGSWTRMDVGEKALNGHLKTQKYEAKHLATTSNLNNVAL